MSFARLAPLVDELSALVGGLDPDTLSGGEARALLATVVKGERLCAAARTLLAGRVEATFSRQGGHRHATDEVAATVGTTWRDAEAMLATAAALPELPSLDAAVRQGALSPAAAVAIAGAAGRGDDTTAAELVHAARRDGLRDLRRRCDAVRRARQADDDAARAARIRARRAVRTFTDADGAYRADVTLAPEEGARFEATLRAIADHLFHEARRAGRREPHDAYRADALMVMVDTAAAPGDGTAGGACRGHGPGGRGPRAMVHVVVDHAALVRGATEAGETCEIPGVGPVPVATARALAADAWLKVLVRDGVDIRAVAHAGRTIGAHLRSALERRDTACVVPGCGMRLGLEIDHIVPLAAGGPTTEANLCRLCRWHHYLKTHQGWRVAGRPGEWRWLAPEAPDDG